MGDEVLVGVEEEFLLVDAESRAPAPRIAHVIRDAERLAGDQAQAELHRSQIEIASSPARTLEDLRHDLADLRAKVAVAAGIHGCSVVASGTYPQPMGGRGRLITSGRRYETIAQDNDLLADEQLICGCHIHVSVPDPEVAIRTMNRIRRWLPILLAMSANSPYWEGEDTGFCSFRTEVWSRWPTAGPIGAFESPDEYRALLDQLVGAGVILDSGMAYWDVRPSQRFPTLEIRISDVMPTVDDAVAVAGVARALVAWAMADDAPAGTDGSATVRPELLRAAGWRAAHDGLSGDLMDPLDGSVLPAHRAVEQLLFLLGPTMRELGDDQLLVDLVRTLLERGSGADRQRAVYGTSHDLVRVIDALTLTEGARTAPT
jgi:carboxylate-amine ligase